MAEETPIRMFRVDVNIVGTAYIFAESEEAARRLVVTDLINVGEEVCEGGIVDGTPFETIMEDMRECDEKARVTLSPAITIVGPCLDDGDFALEEDDL